MVQELDVKPGQFADKSGTPIHAGSCLREFINLCPEVAFVDQMDPTTRVMAALGDETPDRVPVMSVLTDLTPAYQVLGFPRVSDRRLLGSGLVRWFLRNWGMGWPGRALAKWDVERTLFKCVEAAVRVGFDAAWAVYAPNFARFPDPDTIQDDWGSLNRVTFDQRGTATYTYASPALSTREEYEAWEYFPDPKDHAKRARRVFRRLVSKFGRKICVCGEVVCDLYDRVQLGMGFKNLVLAMRRDPALVRQFVARLEDYALATTEAMMDAGVRVVFKGDDFSFKTGPQMNPKTFDEFWGPSYARLCELVHDRGGKIILHSCGDNTEMFDCFIKWGFDGGHAFETTSNVDVLAQKRRIGDRFTIVGGAGVDYLLTAQSKPEEVVAETERLVRQLGPGGRFILAPVHSLPIVDMDRERLMVETCKRIGSYPIAGA
ncbi:MAG: hypothetical protein Kow0069_30380 [Promethearchaeota archaeon]